MVFPSFCSPQENAMEMTFICRKFIEIVVIVETESLLKNLLFTNHILQHKLRILSEKVCFFIKKQKAPKKTNLTKHGNVLSQ